MDDENNEVGPNYQQDMHDEVATERNYQAGHFPLVQAGNYQDLNFLCNKLGVSNHIKEY